MQKYTSGVGSAASVTRLPGTGAPTDEALREELAKWRERVPKLAAALRQRAEEADALKLELERVRAAVDTGLGGQHAPAGIRARDERIGELEAKLADLAERNKAAEAELHRRALTVAELQEDSAAWKQKWQALTRSLDEQAQAFSQREQQARSLAAENAALRERLADQLAAFESGQRSLHEAVTERDSLRQRNDQLFETTEMANRRIMSLSDSVTELRQSLKREREQAQARIEQAQARMSTLQADQDAARALLEGQLGERSALVMTLEQDRADLSRRLEAVEQQRDELDETRMRAERHAGEYAEHVGQLDDKVERQQELMSRLEEELAEARQQHARAVNDGNDRLAVAAAEHSAERATLQGQARKLENLLRERTDALNKLEWQQRMSVHDSAGGETAEQAQQRAGSEARLLLVLNQQLANERSHSAELLERVRELELLAERRAPRGDRDDLTRIHGVGVNLAKQLNDLGLFRYQQIAELDASVLDDETHALHVHRGRILRDRWVAQAAELSRLQTADQTD